MDTIRITITNGKTSSRKRMMISELQHITCGSRLLLPMPLGAEWINGTYTVFIEAYCPKCKSSVLIRLNEYFDAYQAAANSKTTTA